VHGLRKTYCIIGTEKYEIMKWHFVENETDYAACLKNAVDFLVA
jgi:hypothetical protein